MQWIQLRKPALTVLVSLLTGTALAQSVDVTYDRGRSFQADHTYAWGIQSNPDKIRDATLAQEAQRQIDQQLQSKGLHLIQETQNPDLIVVANGGWKVDTYYEAWGTISSGSSGMPMFRPVEIETSTLVVELYDPKAQQLVWRGMAKGTLTSRSAKDIKLVRQAVSKLFKKYPRTAPK